MTDHDGLVDWERTARRMRTSALTLLALTIVVWLVAGVLSDGPSAASFAGWLGLALGVMFVIEVVVVGGAALRGMLRAGERGERLASPDVGLFPRTPPATDQRGGGPVRLTANDQEHEVDAGATVGDFVRTLGLDPRYVVVERNGEVVHRTDADTTSLADGDRLIVVRAVAGGAERSEHARHAGIAGGAADPFPSLSVAGERRQARLRDARLYVVTDARRDRDDLEAFLTTITGASADIVQLRDKTATEDELRAASDVFRRVCDRTGALFVLNDFPGLAVQVGADGVHVGQEDVHPDHARRVVGPDLLIGRSTHSEDQIDAAADEDVDYFAVGPIHATPTKEGRPAVGLGPVKYAARHAAHPWFAIGGLNQDTVGDALEAGARRVVVVRAVTQADDAESACWSLRRTLAAFHED